MQQQTKKQTFNNQLIPFVLIASCISALGGILFGYDTGVISSAILFIKEDFHLSTVMEEFVLSSALIGAVIGAIVGGRLTDWFGRRTMIIMCAIVFTFGAFFGASAARTVEWLIAGRIIIGICIGISSFAAPLYISEIAPVDKRGFLVGLNQLAVTVGIVVSYFVGYLLSGYEWGWRGMFAAASIPSMILGIGMYFMPNSPRWLSSKGRKEEARTVLEKIRGTHDVEEEITEIDEGLKVQSGGLRELFQKSLRPAMIVGIGLAVLQQVTGINTVIYYAPTIFEFAGFKSAASAILATVGVGIVNVVATIFAILYVDRMGRRRMLLFGLIGMTLSLFALGLAFQYQNQIPEAMGWISMGSLMAYVAFFAISLGPIFWLLISEIYPLKVRGQAMSVATFFNWGSNFVMGVTFLTLIHRLGASGTFYLYGALSVFAWFFVYFMVPETKNRSLEEIEAYWKSGGHYSTDR